MSDQTRMLEWETIRSLLRWLEQQVKLLQQLEIEKDRLQRELRLAQSERLQLMLSNLRNKSSG